jgi:outer membrane protein OmpA-like peptidoglycan-associated protein
MKKMIMTALLLFVTLANARAQTQNDQSADQNAIIKISVSRGVQAVNYNANTSSKIEFKGTALMPSAQGEAKVENKKGIITITADFEKLGSATQFGPEFLTFVLWAITPEGLPNNLGELPVKGDKSKLVATTRLPSFGMIVTAEPYFAVAYPSEEVVLEGLPGSDAKGAVTPVQTKLLKRSSYEEAKLEPMTIDPKTPLVVYEARNALRIAKAQQADKYAPDAWAKAQASSARMEDYIARKQKNPILTVARDTVQQAEDARTIAIRKAADEEAAALKQAQDQKMAEQKAQQQAAELAAANDAAARAKAESQPQQAEMERQKAEAAKKQADLEAQKSAEAAAKAEREQQELRAQLLAQLNAVLQTKDTPRGLVVTMADILFATGKYDLAPAARERLAKLSGILLAHPGLKLTIEGYTDSTGSEDFNLKLSGQRADAVRDYLIQEGLNGENISSKGLGMANPVADNKTADGRKQNRRVEIIVSGEAIGTKIGQ